VALVLFVCSCTCLTERKLFTEDVSSVEVTECGDKSFVMNRELQGTGSDCYLLQDIGCP
jgi:hypothetical protein